ncbi:dynein axonemal heavy chain 6 [Anthonomus grandis grandis]|uniref:dynein axonemal heavy chain 6 n=1 Tax=Anthonomus grandis grandis TaxID=2921223 RepID=UPI002166B223|nr:dynein axonemal heavy chain 6 [Anthonomus grandis grandis]
MAQRGEGDFESQPSESSASNSTNSDIRRKARLTGKLICVPPISMQGMRGVNVVPFHYPHKRLLEKIDYKIEEPEPLTGFKRRQEELLNKRIKLPPIQEISLQPQRKLTGVSYKSSSVSTVVTFLDRASESDRLKSGANEKLSKVVDQKEWIQKMRTSSDGSFVYFTYAVPKSSELFNPYMLKVVGYKEVDKNNFFTMSAKGVMQHIGSEVIFTPLDKWEAEYDMFQRLMNIRTFRMFRKWKGFYVWRKNIIYTKFTTAQKSLAENIFFLNPLLRQGLIDIQYMCYKMIDTNFVDLSEKENVWLFYFIENQMDKLIHIREQTTEFHELAKEIVSNACHGALLAKGFVPDERIVAEEQKDQRRRRQQKASYIEQASKKKFCERLSAYIMLVDYMSINMLHQLMINSINELNILFENHTKYLPGQELLETTELDKILEQPREKDDPQLPLFVVNVILEPDIVKLDPTVEVAKYIFRQIIELWEGHCIGVKPFVADPLYSIFTTPVINEKVEDRICGWGPTFEFYLNKDEKLAQEKERFFKFFDINYDAANLYIQRLEPVREFFAEDLMVCEEDIQQETVIENFRNMCTRYNSEIDVITNITNSQALGLLYLMQDGFKNSVLPEPRRLLEIAKDVIPWIGREKVAFLTQNVEEMETYLAQEPIMTVDYVKYLEYIDEATSRVDKMEEILDYCKELYDITEEFSILVAHEEMTNYLGLSVSLGNLRNLVDKKIEETGRIVKSFNDQMNKDISALISEVGVIKDECMQPWLYDIDSNTEEVTDFLTDLHDRLLGCQARAQEFKNYQKQFRLEVSRFDMLDEVMNDVKLRMLLWESVDTWAKTVDEWYHCEFNTLNTEDMNLFTAKNVKNIGQLEKGLPPNLIVPKLKDEVELMKDKLPVITFLRNPALKTRHWVKVENVLNHKFKPEEVMTLELLESLNVFSYPQELMEISGQASSEAGLEALLKKVEESWKSLEFIVLSHKDSKDVFILGSLEDVQAVLDESNINITTIASSRHVGPIKNRVEEWQRNLDLFSHTLDEWMMCQQSWVYLEVIFSAPDIQRQLPNEAKLFTVVDKSWKEIMRRTAKMPLAMEAALQPGILEAFQRNNSLLEQIMKCLESYLETKRVAFPRFYFLSNDELLDILAQTRNPHAVQPHLRKCFDAIAKLEFGMKPVDEGDQPKEASKEGKKEKAPTMVLTTDIIAMISPEGERVALSKGLKARGNVEDWLGKVEESMFLSLRKCMKVSMTHYMQKPRTEWVVCHPNQIILTVSQIMWAKGVHEILDGEGNTTQKMEKYMTKSVKDLNDLAALVRSDLSSVTRKILIALITIDVHARDTIFNLVKGKVSNSNSFDWLKVLRYYWFEAIDDCMAKMSSASYLYGYEYLGAGGVLVITPLTDKCYLCLMGALQLDLGGAPAGPAGTGKTETTKDLAKALAIQCVVFNCSEGLDYKMMGRFFSGLAQSGAWCCFDEFNRIDIEVLSVIAQQLITIRNAKAAKLSRFMFEGREIKLIQKCAAFITMNPGYAGRTELPDNLKALFRPISMMVPDYALIAEVILYSEGFESSKNLSQKMVQMYKLCSEQLSQQDHYDFGMRAVKSVLVMAGALKRANPDRNEDVVLICALRDSNLPKFLSDDAILFQGILGDLFPGTELPVSDYGVFQETMIEVMVESNLQPELCMISKVIQLHETMIVRWGVMLVGPTGGGKTTILNTLNWSLSRMHEKGQEGPYYHPVHTYIMNPKAVSAGELYGEVNPFTLEWRDGLMGIMMRTAVQNTTEDHQWIICDGPVDAVWIENLNTVLDDNKMLCLANSERIKLTPYVHMVFEVQDLAQASPATVSRCGMVYVDSEEIKWLPYVKSWINTIDDNILNDELKEFLLGLFVTYVEDGFSFVKKYAIYAIHQVDISKARMICSLIQSQLYLPGAMEKIGERAKVRCFVCQTFISSYLWGLGGNITEESREKFEIFVQTQFEECSDARLPPGQDLWYAFMDVQSKRLTPWQRIMPEFVYDKNIPFFDTLVPTLDTVRFGYIMERLINVNHAVMITGDTGVGKSVVAKDVLNRLGASDQFVPATMNFSAQTSSMRTQEIIELKLERKKKTLLGAPLGKKVVIFVDDVNMPKLETYGAQPPIELIRQLLDYGGLYDREKLFWKEIRDVILTTACAPPGGGRNPLTPRFVRHFGMLLLPSPNEQALKSIFKAILKGFLFDFSNECRDVGDYMVNAAVDIYDRIATDLLPTPSKSHYVFNLRDLSKCIQGITQADSGTMRAGMEIMRLFYHECLRVFHDRLINVEDKSYFYFLMKEICTRNFGTPVLTLPETSLIEDPPILLFGDFMVFGAERENRIYEELKNIDKLKSILQDYLDDFNLMFNKDMQVIFFMMAVEHCVRIARILRSERGNALLVGVGGMGKQSLTKLASHVNGYKCFQIELVRNYDHSSFFEDLRKFYFYAGVENMDAVFLFTDTQIAQEEFLEDINNILNSGDVPNLFEADEYEKVIIGSRDAAKKAGFPDGRDHIYEYFISRVRSNLHLVICMSPVGDAFRRRCRMFPSLVNCCTIDWFEKWPQEALLSVALSSLKDIGSPELCSSLSTVCVTIHESVEEMTLRFYREMKRYYYTTPSSYLELIKLYKHMLKERKEKITKTRDRIANGLQKLYETNDVIDSMKETLIALEPELAKKSIAVAELMKNLAKEQKSADKVRVTVKTDEEHAKIKADETQVLADDAQRDLDTALPALEAATKALEALNKNDINEVKVFQKPPKLVQFVMESVCILLGAKTDWAASKIVLGDTNFLKKLQDYDKDHITDIMLKKLKTYVEHPDFVPEKVVTVSKACKSLCMWVRAVDMYAKVYRIVEPKRKKLQSAEKELNAVMSLLREKQKQLADVEAMIAALEAKFNATVAEKEALENNIALTSARLNRAGRLNIALGDEQTRWEDAVKNFAIELVNCVGDVMMAAACVAYQGAFTSNYRQELTQTWEKKCIEQNIPSTENFNLLNVLADPYEIRTWNACGLPRDSVSTENAIMVTKANRWPLMIDPQEQANRWIRQMEAENNMKVIKLTDPNFMRILENGIRIGMPVLLEEVGESLDPTLGPILMKQTFVQGGRTLIHLGDSDVEYDPNFKFYITSKLANPHYLPEVCIQVTIVNFTVTPSGLEDQLLADVVRLERPELELQRNELVVKINTDKAQLKGIEDKILFLLYHSEGNILDDEELIETLNESKETSAIIEARLTETEATEEKISIAREKYRSVSTRGSVLYFVVANLAEIDPMYQYSLKYFNQVFNNVIQTTEKNPVLEQRLSILRAEITLAVYTIISRGLFERHKLVFSFMLCIAIMQQEEKLTDAQWSFLLRGPVGSKSSAKKPDLPVITDAIWQAANFLETSYQEFQRLSEEITKAISLSIGEYKLTIKLVNNSPNSSINWDQRLNDFEKLLLIKTLQEEKLVFAITEFVNINMGHAFIESPQVSLNLLYQDTSNAVPLIFVLSTGSDPFGAFQRFAADMGYTNKLKSISLGQGQGPVAEKMIQEALETGDWIFLQNCHLATSWMLSMEKIVLDIAENAAKVNKTFRLYMSSMPSKFFPVAVLQNSVKVTNEPPKGLRANMKRAFAEMLEDFFENHPLKQNWRSILFGICMFHAIVQERKKFGPLGWNIVYEFNDSDRDFAFNTFKMFCAEGFIPWDALEYLTGEITYGGRVTDYWDLRCLKTILKIFFSPPTLVKNYKYSVSGTYYCPQFDKLQNYRDFIDKFPIIEEPEIFGMHENANIAFQIKETQTVIKTIMESQPRSEGGGDGKSSDEIVYELAEHVREVILKKIETEELNIYMFKKDAKGRLPSLTTVLTQEVDRYNKLLKLIHNSMDQLQKAIKGLVVMSEALEDVYKAFMNNQVPHMWSAKAYNSLKSLGSWVVDLTLRLDFISTWLRSGHPTSYWLSGFYFPQGFLTGTLQTHARKYNLPIDKLKFDFLVKPVNLNQEEIMAVHVQEGREVYQVYRPLDTPSDGVLVHGLFLDAGRWDMRTMKLVDPKPGEINPSFPVIHMIPTTDMHEDDPRYVCPLYKTSIRAGVLSTTGHSTNFVIAVLLPTVQTQSYWILKGTALLTQITD